MNVRWAADRLHVRILDRFLRALVLTGLTCAPADVIWATQPICATTQDELLCLQRNFHLLYASHYDEFWSILQRTANTVANCGPDTDLVPLLELGKVDQQNAEFEEFFRQQLESLATRNPSCLFENLLRADKASTRSALQRLRQPLLADRSTIDGVFLEAQDSPRYRGLARDYFSIDP